MNDTLWSWTCPVTEVPRARQSVIPRAGGVVISALDLYSTGNKVPVHLKVIVHLSGAKCVESTKRSVNRLQVEHESLRYFFIFIQ